MKKIVTIGGGTGTFVVLSGLRDQPVELSAIVSVADDGGSTGRLRDAYGHLPPGDVRQALVALSEQGTMLRRLFTHRFEKGDIAGHNFGNLYITALSEILGSDTEALAEAAAMLKVKGQVIPVSQTPAVLCAEYTDGSTLVGQGAIGAQREERGVIKRLYLQTPCVASKEAIEAILEADIVVMGPGDIYTSTLANFVTSGLSDALMGAKAKVVYVMNLFSTPESGAMTMHDYVEAVTQYTKRTPDVLLVNSTIPSKDAIAHYAAKGQQLIVDDLHGEHVIRGDFLSTEIIEKLTVDAIDRSLVRHDGDKLARAIMTL